MAAMEQPFGENEVRFFLAEILKKSSIAPLDLMNIIQERGIQPNWYEMALPNGRSVHSCMGVWRHLQANSQARFAAPFQPMVTFEHSSPQSAAKPKKKRPASGENVPSVVDRMIQPQQPLNFQSVNAPSDLAKDQGATPPVLGGPPKKKRGRPSKAEYEAKVAEAAARGEEYQAPPKRKKTPRPSLQGAPNPGMVTPTMNEISAAGEGFTGNIEEQKPKAAPEGASNLASEPTARSFALEVTAHAADQTQVDESRPIRSTIPETQASGVEIREGLSADPQEHAEHTAPSAVQSSTTLRHDSTPQNDFMLYQGPKRDQ